MSSKLVIDSSVIVKWLSSVDEQLLEKADKILKDAIEGSLELIAPELAKYEIGNVLLLKKKLSPEQIEFPIHALYSYPIQFVQESENLANETFKIAAESKITYYDASFIALAQQEDAILVTDNIKHQGKYKGVAVKSLSEY